MRKGWIAACHYLFWKRAWGPSARRAFLEAWIIRCACLSHLNLVLFSFFGTDRDVSLGCFLIESSLAMWALLIAWVNVRSRTHLRIHHHILISCLIRLFSNSLSELLWLSFPFRNFLACCYKYIWAFSLSFLLLLEFFFLFNFLQDFSLLIIRYSVLLGVKSLSLLDEDREADLRMLLIGFLIKLSLTRRALDHICLLFVLFNLVVHLIEIII